MKKLRYQEVRWHVCNDGIEIWYHNTWLKGPSKWCSAVLLCDAGNSCALKLQSQWQAYRLLLFSVMVRVYEGICASIATELGQTLSKDSSSKVYYTTHYCHLTLYFENSSTIRLCFAIVFAFLNKLLNHSVIDFIFKYKNTYACFKI